MKTKGFRVDFNWKGFGFGLYGRTKLRRSGLYGGDRLKIILVLLVF